MRLSYGFVVFVVIGNFQALTLHYQSYMNTMKIVVAVDESTIPYPHQLLDDLAESLKVIKEAIPTKSKCTHDELMSH